MNGAHPPACWIDHDASMISTRSDLPQCSDIGILVGIATERAQLFQAAPEYCPEAPADAQLVPPRT